MREVWRRHPEIAFIEVSTEGRVRSVERLSQRGHRLPQRERKQTPTSDGYRSVEIAGRTVKVHTLVLATFVGPCPDGLEVLHGDADRANNRLSNLRYGTRSENQLQRVADGNHHLANRTECPRGHALAVPNLRAYGLRVGKRQCLACHLGLQWARRHPGADLQAACDRFYPLTA